LGIISNGRSNEQRRKLTAVKNSHRFEHVLVSEDCGHAKPGAEIFRLACRMAGVPAAQALYVGDQYELDACGARNAGLRGIWLDRSERAPREDRGLTIVSLEALTRVLHSRDLADG
jgi:putative hydrolase of the HAD superfamily